MEFFYVVSESINRLFLTTVISNLLSVIGVGLIIFVIVLLFRGVK